MVGVYDAHREMVRAVRIAVPVPHQAHRLALLAKETVFRAQDALHDVADPKVERKLRRRLAKIRSELEALDRDWLNAQHAEASNG
jgi:hypothetical protein